MDKDKLKDYFEKEEMVIKMSIRDEKIADNIVKEHFWRGCLTEMNKIKSFLLDN